MKKQLLFKYKGSSLYKGAKEFWITFEGLLFLVHYGLKIAHAFANDEAFLIEIYLLCQANLYSCFWLKNKDIGIEK